MHLAQRDGCWVRQTKSFPGNTREEVGVCAKAPPKWSSDRVTRLVQECMADADYRWQNRAIAAWNRGQPLPPEQSEHEVMQQCMNDAATSLVTENQALQKRIAELTHDRDGLAAETAQDHKDLRDNQNRMTEALGEAAKRPTPNAFAFSTSSGEAATKSDPQPAPTPVVIPTTVVPPTTTVIPPTVVPVQVTAVPSTVAPQTTASTAPAASPKASARTAPVTARPSCSTATPRHPKKGGSATAKDRSAPDSCVPPAHDLQNAASPAAPIPSAPPGSPAAPVSPAARTPAAPAAPVSPVGPLTTPASITAPATNGADPAKAPAAAK